MISLYLVALIIAPQLWIPPFVGLQVDYLLYPLWAVVLLFRGRLLEVVRFRVIDVVFLAMLGWIIVTTVVNPTNVRTTSTVIDYFKWFVMYRFVIASIADFPALRKTLWIALVFVMVIVVESIEHKLSPDGIGWAGQSLGWVDPSVLAQGGTGRTRWINIFDGPGVFCVLFTIGLPIVLVLLGPPFGWAMRLFGLCLLVPLLVATYFTGSRGGLLAALAILALYLLLRFRVSTIKIGLIGAVVGALYIAAPDHLTSTRDENKSAQHRVEVWAKGVDMVEANPVFGVGKENYRVYTGRLIAHSSPIEIMGETGVIGLFVWITLLYTAIKGVWLHRTGDYDATDKAYSTALLLIVVGYIVSALFVTLEYETLYFILALCAVVGNHLKQPVSLGKWDLLVTAAIPLIWIVVVKVFATIYFL
jgi:O-antigen ligase